MNSLKRACERLLGGVSKRSLMLILALCVTLAATAGGTLALLYGTQNVKNTFTYSADINISLDETDTGLDGDISPETNQYPMYPGQDIHKDPTVTVHAGSMDCWLFVEVEKSWNFDTYLAYEMADGWLELPGYPGVYYREVSESPEAQQFPVIKGNVVHMQPTVTLGMLYGLTNADYPTLTISAYAIQRDINITDVATPQSAWALLPAGQTFAPPIL